MRVIRRGTQSKDVRRSLGRDFGWLWTAYAVSAYGTGLGFGAFAIIAIRVLHAGAAQVAILSASGLAVGALIAVPLGPWVEFRRKRPVMVGMDLVRFAALVSIPVAYALGRLTFLQLVVVSVIVGAAKNRLPGRQRRVRQGAGRSRGPARGQRAIRVHHLERDRGRTAAGRSCDRAARAGDHGRRRRDQLPALRAGDRRHPAHRATREACRREARARHRTARRLALHPRPPRVARPVLQHGAGQRAHPGHRAAALRPDARTSGVRAVAVRPRLRLTVRRRADRRPAGPPARPASWAGEGHVHRRRAARVLAGRAGPHAAAGSPGWRSSSSSSSASSPASACSTPSWPPTGSSRPRPIASLGCCRRGRCPPARPSPRSRRCSA